MLEEIKYHKPPIVEVVCEFRFVPGDPWDAATPGLVYAELQTVFPLRKTLRILQSAVSPAEDGIQQQVLVVERAQFLREDEKAFTQVGPNLLAVNHLEPYPTWETFRPLIQHAYSAYREVTGPVGLQRIGLRYINRLEFPAQPVEFSDFLNFYPFTGPDLPQMVHAFDLRVQSAFESERDILRLHLSSLETGESGRPTALLDLDYFLAHPQAIELEAAFDWVNQAHDQIQVVFEACVTDALRATFEPVES